MEDTASELLSGAYDLHVHASPDVVNRKMGLLELKREASRAGMKGFLFKSHVFETASLAQLANEIDPSGARVFGCVSLNYAVGGLNPYAVHEAIKLGAKEVYLPTYSSGNHLSRFRHERDVFPYHLPEDSEGIFLLDENNELKSEVIEVLEIAFDGGVVVGTGHISPLESKRVIERSEEIGTKILITHPLSPLVQMPLDLLKELTSKGNVWAEFTYVSTTPTIKPPVSMKDMAKAIKLVGPENTILSSDLGQAFNEPPVEGFKKFIGALLKEGLTKEELRMILHENPEILLGL